MNDSDVEARVRAIKTYNAAADRYDDPANSFWERFGRLTVERMQLSEGARVLDVCIERPRDAERRVSGW